MGIGDRLQMNFDLLYRMARPLKRATETTKAFGVYISDGQMPFGDLCYGLDLVRDGEPCLRALFVYDGALEYFAGFILPESSRIPSIEHGNSWLIVPAESTHGRMELKTEPTSP